MNRNIYPLAIIILAVVFIGVLFVYFPITDNTPKYQKISNMELEAVQRQAFEEGKSVGRNAMLVYFSEYLTDSMKCVLCNDTNVRITLQIERLFELEKEYTEKLKEQKNEN